MKLPAFLCLISISAMAQDNKAVMDPINMLFEGMKKGDSAMVHSAFYGMPAFSTVSTDVKGQPVLRGGTLPDFLKAIGTPHKDVYNELIWDPKIEVDGNFAQVWVDYAFYAGKTFSHCGVDAFHLFRNASGQWKIFALADTRQKTGCSVPKEVSDLMK
jgi:hypothetical protein